MNDGLPLEARRVCKYYGGAAAVNEVSFSVAEGECAGILGPNGAGKSTLLGICLGVRRQDSGEVRLLGCRMPEDALLARARTGVVPQKDMLDPDFTCAENLSMYARYFGAVAPPQKIAELLDFAGLSARNTTAIGQLSGGMQRRLALARALVNDPRIIFLDEPTTGLDPQARHLIWERLRNLQESGKTLLLTTHFMEEAERLCDRLMVMDGGRIIAEGAPEDLVREQVEPEVVEVHGAGATEWLDSQPTAGRRENFGRLSYCHVDDAAPLLAALRETSFRFVHRRAGMEDVFLRLTGRGLRE
ncbi:MAG: ATP-binding cassette domain-containing protein [Betaproteobacteria bacterium]|nr:ATP-binding cassette domain-containing protein [Betaproteobacteria bacterium]